MANLSREDILKLAHLARLHLSDDEVTRFAGELGAVLGYVEQLQEVELGDLEPTFQVTGLTNVMRPDEPVDYKATREELLKNAPSTENGHFKVKRMVG